MEDLYEEVVELHTLVGMVENPKVSNQNNLEMLHTICLGFPSMRISHEFVLMPGGKLARLCRTWSSEQDNVEVSLSQGVSWPCHQPDSSVHRGLQSGVVDVQMQLVYLG